MIAAICTIILLFHLTSVPFSFDVEGHVDVFSNDGFVKVLLFGWIKIFNKQAFVEKESNLKRNLVLKGKKKEKFYHLNADKSDEKSISKLLNIDFVPNVKISEIDFVFAIGKKNDAFLTAMTVGGVRIAIYSFLCKVKCLHNVIIKDEVLAEFNKDELYVRFYCIFNVSIADIIFSYILHLLRKRRRNGNRTQRASN